MILAPAAVVGAGFCVCILWAGMDKHHDPLPLPAPVPPPPSAAPPRRPTDPAEMHLLRSRDEVIVLLRRTDFGLPVGDAPVRILDGEGAVLREGLTDGSGVHRGPLPAGAAAVETEWKGVAVRRALPAAPDPLPPDLPFLVDRSILRPGDRVRLLLLAAGGPPPAPRLMLLDGEGEEVEGVSLAPAEDPAVEEPWALFEGTVPDDVPPGRARFSAGEVFLESLPVVARFGGPASLEDGGPPLPPPPAAAHGAHAVRAGAWRRAVPTAAPGARGLFAALSGDRLLSHAAVAVERGEAAVTLPAAIDGGPVTVRAVAMTPAGFLEAGAAVPASGDGARMEIRSDPGAGGWTMRLRPAGRAPEAAPGPSAAVAVAASDPTGRRPFTGIVAAASADRLSLPWRSPEEEGEGIVFVPTIDPISATEGIPARLRAVAAGGGLSAVLRGTGALPGSEGAAPRVIHLGRNRIGIGTGDRGVETFRLWGDDRSTVLLLPGREASWPGRGRVVEEPLWPPSATAVAWRLEAPPEAEGPFRVTADGGIVIEGHARPATGTEDDDGDDDGDDGRTGTVDAAAMAKGPLLLEARIPGLRGLLLEGPSAPAPEDAPAEGEGISVERSFPARGRAGGTAEAVLVLRTPAARGPLDVELPLPGGTAPAEDGWEIRARAPQGTRVSIPRDGEWGVAGSVRWRLPGLAAGETRLAVRLRLEAPGDYAAPAATADSLDPTGPWGRSGAGRLVIE